MEIRNKIIEYCEQKMISTTEVADAMGKTGIIPLLQPVNHGQYRVGPIRCLFAANDSNYDIHVQAQEIQPGEIPVIFVDNCDKRAIIGDIIVKFMLVHKKAAAVVVQGLVRDAGELMKRQYPVWSSGFSPIGCFNVKRDPFPEQRKQALLDQYQGAIAICDECGVVAIPKEQHTEIIVEKLERIQMQEAVWNYCLDTLHWDTKRIVCDKEYLRDEHIEKLPQVYRDNILRLKSPLDNV